MYPLIHVRGAQLSDANALVDIDIKCFDDAWPANEWNRIGHSHGYAISVATMYGTPIGFGVFRHDEDTGTVAIEKLAVKPFYRRKGASLLILAGGVDYARTKAAQQLTIIVPENTIYPPSIMAEWLKAVGFKATKPFLKRHFESYGEFEDGVKFIAPLRFGNEHSSNAA